MAIIESVKAKEKREQFSLRNAKQLISNRLAINRPQFYEK